MKTFDEWWKLYRADSQEPETLFMRSMVQAAWYNATMAERERAARVADEESEVHRRCSNIYESTACKKVAKHIRSGAELPEGSP